MSKRFKVFLGAPAPEDTSSKFSWQHAQSHPTPSESPGFSSYVLDASRRISTIYQNIVFKDDDGGESLLELGDEPMSPTSRLLDETTRYERTTFIWGTHSQHQDRNQTTLETQFTDSYSYNETQSSDGSIARFPSFDFSLHTLVSLSTIKPFFGTRKVCVLMAVLEVDGPDVIKIGKGTETGKEIGMFKMILGDEDGAVCKLTAWREVADVWSGVAGEPGIKRGDVVYLENVSASCEPGTPLALTASPHLKSKAEICYRTMPRASFPEDQRLRSDLRLGYSDATVRKVASVVTWFEKMADLAS